MTLSVRGETFVLPGENNTQNVTGREIIEIEDAFGLDGLTLLELLGVDENDPKYKPHPNPKYTKVKALYAVTWVAMSRAGKVLSIDDVLNTYGIDEISSEDSEAPKELTANDSSEAAPAV